MREIKFKYIFRHKTDGDMQTEVFTLKQIEKYPLKHHESISDYLKEDGYELVDRVQYIGVGIYEGDIVTCVYRNGYFEGVAVYDDKLKRVCIHINMDKSGYHFSLQEWNHAHVLEMYALIGYDFEVIGNIYENKELL